MPGKKGKKVRHRHQYDGGPVHSEIIDNAIEQNSALSKIIIDLNTDNKRTNEVAHGIERVSAFYLSVFR